MTSRMHLASGRYRLIRPVGEGGMAVVYRAVDELLGRPVAVKILRPQFAGDREFVERFRREAQAAASLSHPNVVQIFDVGRDNGSHYIVMELVDGKSLKQILQEHTRLDPVAAVAVTLAVAKALSHAHRHGLIHRDIKPHNILVTTEGLVKVADFGIARAASATSLTDSGTVLGSVHYFSPEQARGQSIGVASDLYSLGIVLYEMLTGHVPFTADSPIAVAIRQIHDPVPPIRDQVPGVPPQLERTVMHLLAKDPARRPASADALYEELRRAIPEAEEFPLLSLLQRPRGHEGAGAGRGEKGRRRERSTQPERPAAAAADGAPTQVVTWPRAAAEARPGAGGREGAYAPTAGRTHRGRSRLYTVAFVVAFMAGLVWAASHFSDLLFPREVVVPNIVGRTEAEARMLLERQHLSYGVDQRIYSDSVPSGQIIRQDPESGRRVREGRKIWATVSLGPEVGVVPDLVGKSLRDAQLLLVQQGFARGEVTYGYAPDRPPNTVITQDPEPNTQLEKGRPVNLVVSRGEQPPATVTIPDLTGLPLDDARRRLEALGLQIGNTWAEYNQQYPSGAVVDQDPAPGSQVEQGWSVDVIYSQGPPPTAQEGGGAAPVLPSAPGASGGAAPQATPSPGSASAPPPGDGASGPAGPSSPAQGQAPGAAGGTGPAAATSAPSGKWRTAEVGIQVPPGKDQEVVILVIDDFGAKEVFRRTVAGGSYLAERVRGRGPSARFQVYIGGAMVEEAPFPQDGP
ncbi:Stk1 family PASTA domain-containing Ser/Thr kinase [Carboxydochorda subterranea]|uniref:non-specific serine/threonine protein kinase n=1 Tax=Carboxydichorda subterranea TaxID=3109565 RepID=A0ABZ1C2N3_9FIRM|nr:Stk1 family PASTA domain-containing Ser/Thr kinase [Limnochorda sp. L945t]WRP18403.1 Stk1 family PASTA domain-containing Ser/Thr kinase [Limnochorda sp. L945t]